MKQTGSGKSVSEMEETANNAIESGQQEAAGHDDAGGEGKIRVYLANCIINNKSMVAIFFNRCRTNCYRTASRGGLGKYIKAW